tara:strand:- start:226 stop:540 length:315 start_codon:yes stop_codon:yes gene_type:complete
MDVVVVLQLFLGFIFFELMREGVKSPVARRYISGRVRKTSVFDDPRRETVADCRRLSLPQRLLPVVSLKIRFFLLLVPVLVKLPCPVELFVVSSMTAALLDCLL